MAGAGSTGSSFNVHMPPVLMCDIYVSTVWGSTFWDCEGVEQSSERLDFVSSVGVVGGGKENE